MDEKHDMTTPAHRCQTCPSKEVPSLSFLDHNGRKKDTSKCGGMNLDMKIPSMSEFIPMKDICIAEPKFPLDNIDHHKVIPPSKEQGRNISEVKCYQNRNEGYNKGTMNYIMRSDEGNTQSEGGERERISTSTRIEMKRRNINTKQMERDIKSNIHTITACSNRLNDLLALNDITTIGIHVNSDDLSSTKAITSPHTDLSSLTSKKFNVQKYSRNPTKRKFIKLTTRILNHSNGEHSNIENSNLTLQCYFRVTLNLINTFANGILVGLSINHLLQLATIRVDKRVDVQYIGEYSSNVIICYILLLHICMTATITKLSLVIDTSFTFRREDLSKEDERKEARIHTAVLCIVLVALLLTLFGSKIELFLSEYTSSDLNTVILQVDLMDKMNTLKRLYITRSILCILQWVIFCWRMVHNDHNGHND
jgi:hypothetical protein